MTNEFPPFEYPPLDPIIDPAAEFDIFVERLEQLEERQRRGYQNLAELEDMQFALNREHTRFEHICDEIVRQSEEMLEGMQKRHLNDPTTQPERSPSMQVLQGEQNERQPPTLMLGTGSPVNPTSPGFICTINEEDLVSAFLRDTPSPERSPEVSYGNDLVRRYRSQLCFLMETKTSVSKAKKLIMRWSLNNGIGTDARGQSGGTLLVWNDSVTVDLLNMNKNLISAYIIKVSG
ncbi:hypothetical protein COLO4_24363 [Corchorus olitorius]|uniref:Uncharacterized protein n=1 Tax=Corchorus olitorius TaxID=93759 RepID=A0A1R3IAJ7_9ROSI|nr:hypothetical protein COLO4_24363 [Corchorus olitorius]